MFVIELCGVPGCGKTYLVESVKKELKYSEKKIYTREDILDEFFIVHIMRILCFLLRYKLHIDKKDPIFRFIRLYPACGVKYAFQLYNLYQKINCRSYPDDAILLLDEGPIQYMTSIPHSVQLEKNRIVKTALMRMINDCYLVINCRSSIDKCTQRIYERNRKDRFFIEDTKKLRTLLMQKKNNIELLVDIVRQERRCETICTDDSIEINRNKLIEIIELISTRNKPI